MTDMTTTNQRYGDQQEPQEAPFSIQDFQKNHPKWAYHSLTTRVLPFVGLVHSTMSSYPRSHQPRHYSLSHNPF